MWEVRHALLKLERRGLVVLSAIDSGVPALEAIMQLDALPDAQTSAEIVALARIERLGLYDAGYLALALRMQLPLAARDGPLLAAAQRRGVQVYDLR